MYWLQRYRIALAKGDVLVFPSLLPHRDRTYLHQIKEKMNERGVFTSVRRSVY